MANQNFVVHNGLTVGPLTIDATTGSITTTGNITTTGTTLTVLNEVVQGTEAVYGQLAVTATNETTQANTGAIVVWTGGISANGNAYVGKNLYVGGPTAFNQNLLNPTIIAVNSLGGAYAQEALINNTLTSSADFIAYPGDYAGQTNDHGWADLGFTGTSFNDPNFTITKPHDAYVFASAANVKLGGNLVLATDYTGNFNDIVFACGSFLSTAEVLRLHGNIGNSGNAWLKYTTTSTSWTNGALRVDGGVGIAGPVFTNANLTLQNISSAISANVLISATGLNGNITIDPDGTGWLAITASTPVQILSTAASSSTGTGALQVLGGLGVVGDIYAGSIQATPIGSTSRSTGGFTRLGINAAAPANNGELAFTGNVIGGLAQFAAINSTPVGNLFASTGAFTTLTASSTVTLSPASASVTISPTGTGTVTINPATTGSIQNMTGSFTTLTASSTVTLSPSGAAVGISPSNQSVTISPTGTGTVTIAPATAGAINNMSIGTGTAAAGAFTSLTNSSSIGSSDSSTQAATTAFVRSYGGFQNQTVLTSGSVSSASSNLNQVLGVTSGVSKVRITVVGAGGAGGGAQSTTGVAGAGAGGGGVAIYYFTGITGTTAIQYSVGTGGTVATGAGGNGGASSVTFNGITLTGGGGSGGAGGAATGTAVVAGAGGTASGGQVNLYGGPGQHGLSVSATIFAAGGGGGGYMGLGGAVGLASNATSQGIAGSNYGGGGGGVAGSTAARSGGKGGDGLVIIEW